MIASGDTRSAQVYLSVLDGGTGVFSASRVKLETSIKKSFFKSSPNIDLSVDFWSPDSNGFSATVSSGDITKYKNIGIYSSSVWADDSIRLSGEYFKYRLLINPSFSAVNFSKNETSSNELTFSNDSWEDLPSGERSFLTGFCFDGIVSSNEAAKQIRHNGAVGESSYLFKMGEFSSNLKYYDFDDVNSRLGINFVNSFNENNLINIPHSLDRAFLSYDVSFGANSRNVFSYGIEVCDLVDFSGYFQISGTADDPLVIYGYSPRINTLPWVEGGSWNYTDQYERLCSVKGGCQSEDTSEGEPKTICWTGRDITGAEYIKWESDLLKLWASEQFNSDYLRESDTTFSLSGVEVLFTSWTGYVFFGDFISGDKINFSPYNFTGADGDLISYQKEYLDRYTTPPPYDEPSSFSMVYKEDFSDPQQLVDSLNYNFTQRQTVGSATCGMSGIYCPWTGRKASTSGFGGFRLNAVNLDLNSGIIKYSNITYGSLNSIWYISGSGWRSFTNTSGNAVWTDNMHYALGREVKSCVGWKAEKEGLYKINGSIQPISTSTIAARPIQFQIFKNNTTKIFPSVGWHSTYSSNGFLFDSLPFSFSLRSGDYLNILFNTGDGSLANTFFFNPYIEELDDTSYSNINLYGKLRRSFKDSYQVQSEDFLKNWKVYQEVTGIENSLDLKGKKDVNPYYYKRGLSSSENSSFIGYFDNGSLVDYGTFSTGLGVEWNSDLSGSLGFELVINKGMGILNEQKVFSGAKSGNKNSGFNCVISQNGTYLASGRFNDVFSSGDRFGSSGLYSGLYLSGQFSAQTGDKIKFQIIKDSSGDFLDIDFEARVKLLSGFYYTDPQPIWYPYSCPTGLGETGLYFPSHLFPLAEASVCNDCLYDVFGTGLTTGQFSDLSGRLIKISSNHFNSGGYKLDLNLAPLREEISTEVKKNKLKYLLPDTVSLYGSDDDVHWTLLNKTSGIDWTKIKPQTISLTGSIDETGISGFSYIPQILEPSNSGDYVLKVKVPSGSFQDLFDLEKTSYRPGKSAFCPPISKTVQGKVVWPIDWADSFYSGGKSPCLLTGKSAVDQETCPNGCFKCGCTDTYATNYDPEADCSCINCGGELGDEPNCCCEYSDGQSGDGPPIHNLSFYRTGWVLDYVKNGYDVVPIDQVKFKKYKLDLEIFKPSSKDIDKSVFANSFWLKNINLFCAEKQYDIPLTGDPICVIGSDYTVDIFGNVPVRITGLFTGEITSLNSGIRRFKNALMLGEPSGLASGDYVLFHKESGRVASPSGSGFFSGEFFATGLFESGLDGWFYDPMSHQVSLTKTLSLEAISGSGQFSGNFIKLKESTVNRELALGGFLNPNIYTSFTTGATFTGQLTGRVEVYGESGFFGLPVNITGESNSGYINFYQCFSGNSSGYSINFGAPTGYNPASGLISYGEPSEFDYISLNDKALYFTQDSSYKEPDYFSSFSSLMNILTGSSTNYLFNCSFSGNDLTKTINVYSNALGASGNLIDFSSLSHTGGILIYPSSNFLSGGVDLYQQISGTGDFNSCLSLNNIPQTGFYSSASGSGILSGPIHTYQGQRDFSGVWNLLTGDSIYYLDPATEYSNSGYSGAISGSGLGNYPVLLKSRVYYNDSFGVGNGNDIVELGVVDYNSLSTGFSGDFCIIRGAL